MLGCDCGVAREQDCRSRGRFYLDVVSGMKPMRLKMEQNQEDKGIKYRLRRRRECVKHVLLFWL
jgi:hypothetical protein